MKSPYPSIRQAQEESMPGGDLDELDDPEYGGEVNYVPEVPGQKMPHMADGGVVGQLPGMGPEVKPEDLEQFLGGAKAQGDKYGPEAGLALENDIQQRRGSAGNLVGLGLSGLGDAIVQGVARAGNPGFSDRFQGMQDRAANERRGAFRNAKADNLAEVNRHMEMDAKDPASQLSKGAQRAYGPILAKLGLTPDEVAQMPAETIDAITAKGVSVEDARAKLAEIKDYHDAQLGLQGQQLGLQRDKMEGDAAAGEQERKLRAADALKKRGLLRWGWEELTPFPRSDESNILRQQAGLDPMPKAGGEAALQEFTQDVLSYAEQHGLTPAQAQRIKDSRGGQ